MPTLKAIFPSSERAKEFADHFGIVGLRANVIQEGKAVTVSTNDDKSFQFIKQMIRDLREDSRSDKHIVQFITLMRESAVGDRSVELGLLDETTVKIGSDFARRFISLYENLGDDARRKVCFLAIESKQSHAKTVDFIMGSK